MVLISTTTGARGVLTE